MTPDEEWALLMSGKLDEELALVREAGEKAALFAQLRFHALQMGRKLGWAAYFFKSVYGHWPDRAWEKVSPMRPTDTTMALIGTRDRRFVFEQKTKRRREEGERLAEAALLSGGEEFVAAFFDELKMEEQDEQRVGDSETAEALHEGAEGFGASEDGGRMSGVEE